MRLARHRDRVTGFGERARRAMHCAARAARRAGRARRAPARRLFLSRGAQPAASRWCATTRASRCTAPLPSAPALRLDIEFADGRVGARRRRRGRARRRRPRPSRAAAVPAGRGACSERAGLVPVRARHERGRLADRRTTILAQFAANGGRFAQPLRPLPADERRGRGQISRRRFPRRPAGRLRALRGDRRADPARGAQILERRAAGGICHARGGAAAPSRAICRRRHKFSDRLR